MGKLIESYGYDPHMICDDFSADLEYAWSALHDESMSAASMFDTLKNIFYVDSINITPEYDNEDFKGIISQEYSETSLRLSRIILMMR